MDRTTFMILDKLSSSLGKTYSIHSLTNELKRDNHKAYYKNIFDKIKKLSKEDDILLDKIGNSYRISINFDNYNMLILLSQLELMKERQLLGWDEELKMLLSEISTFFRQDFYYINSISVIRPERNKALNRQEFLFILKDLENKKDQPTKKDIIDMHLRMRDLESWHNIKLDYLILRENEFRELLKEQAHNPLKEMISAQTVLTYQENYWLEIKKLIDEGILISSAEEINPAKIDEKDIIYNLGRFGYKEIGGEIEKGNKYALETIIISLLLSGDERRIEAIPVILNKNLERGRKPIFNLLIFLAMKYRREGEILAFLKLLKNYTGDKEISDAIDIMTGSGIKPKKIDERSIKQKMELYYGRQ